MLSNVNLYISSYISNTTAWNMASKPKQKLSSYVSKPHERKEAAIVLCHLSWKYTLKNRTKVWGTCTHVILQIWDFFICFCDCFFLGHSSMLVFDFLDVSASLVGGSWICWKILISIYKWGTTTTFCLILPDFAYSLLGNILGRRSYLKPFPSHYQR